MTRLPFSTLWNLPLMPPLIIFLSHVPWLPSSLTPPVFSVFILSNLLRSWFSLLYASLFPSFAFLASVAQAFLSPAWSPLPSGPQVLTYRCLRTVPTLGQLHKSDRMPRSCCTWQGWNVINSTMGVFWTLGHYYPGFYVSLAVHQGRVQWPWLLCEPLLPLSSAFVCGGELDLCLLRKLSIRLLQKAQKEYLLVVKLNIVDTEKER